MEATIHTVADLQGRLERGAFRKAEIAKLALKAWAPVILFVLVYFGLSRLALSQLQNYNLASVLLSIIDIFRYVIAFLILFIMWRIAVYVTKLHPESPIRQLAKDFKDLFIAPHALINFFVLFFFIRFFMLIFAEVKGNIPWFQAFSWDVTFMQWDRMLHGTDPWKLLQPFLDTPLATFVLNVFYRLWFFLLLGSLFWIALLKRPNALQVRFLVAFMLTWSIGGSLMAVLFSSAGPVYFDNLGLSPNPYAALEARLHEFAKVVPLWDIPLQDFLWFLYEKRDIALGGISAFPSMHNAHALLMALLAWQIDRRLGIAAYVYTFFIFIGSIWLGWHYAVDGYAGFAVALLSWLVAGPVARYIMNRPAMRQYLAFIDAAGTRKAKTA